MFTREALEIRWTASESADSARTAKRGKGRGGGGVRGPHRVVVEKR